MFDDDFPVTRRSVLQASAASLAAGAVGSASASAEGGQARGFKFDTVINVLDEGADPTGEEPVNPIIQDNLADNTLLRFPEGEYKLEQFRNFEGEFGEYDPELYNRVEHFGLQGVGSDKVSLVAPEGLGSPEYGIGFFERIWFDLRFGRNHLVEGFTLDISAENTGSDFMMLPEGDFVMRDIHVHGVNDNPLGGNLLFWVLEEDAHGLVENVRMPDGADNQGPDVAGPGGIFVSAAHTGTLTLRNCHVEGFQDNGLYASQPSPPASVRVIGGYYANSNISQVRLGQPDSVVKNARVEMTEPIETEYARNMRGIRVADGSGVTIKNCEVVATADTGSNGAIAVEGGANEATIENTRVRVDSPYNNAALYAGSPGSGDGPLTVKNLHITGDADGQGWPGAAIALFDRAGSTFENVCIQQPGTARNGFHIARSSPTIRNARVDVAGESIVTIDADPTIERLREAGNCPPVR